MVNVDLRDNHLIENVNAIMKLRKMGIFSDDDLQKMYDRLVEKDRESESKRSMKKTVCDFCGKDINPIKRVIDGNIKITLSKNGRFLDVCNDCYKSLNEWIESKIQKRGNMESEG